MGLYWLQVAFRDSGVGKELSVDTAYLRESTSNSRALTIPAQAAAGSVRVATDAAGPYSRTQQEVGVGRLLRSKRVGQLELSPAGRLFLKRARQSHGEAGRGKRGRVPGAGGSLVVHSGRHPRLRSFEELLTRALHAFRRDHPDRCLEMLMASGRLREHGSGGRAARGSFHFSFK